jgi:hypothetical protein
MCIANIRKYLTKHGFPPYIPQHAEKFPAVLQVESYERSKDTLEVRWKPEGAGSFNVYYDKTKWSKGARIVMGGNTSGGDFRVTSGEGKITIVFDANAKDKNLQIFVKAA